MPYARYMQGGRRVGLSRIRACVAYLGSLIDLVVRAFVSKQLN
jgi:hypothetical protein